MRRHRQTPHRTPRTLQVPPHRRPDGDPARVGGAVPHGARRRPLLLLPGRDKGVAVRQEPLPVAGHRGGIGQGQDLRRVRQLLAQGRGFRAAEPAAGAGAGPQPVQGVHPHTGLDTGGIHLDSGTVKPCDFLTWY